MENAINIKVLKPVTELQKGQIKKDFTAANKEHREMWDSLSKHFHKRILMHAVSIVNNDFSKYILSNAEYFSKNDAIMGIAYSDDHVEIFLSDTFLEFISVGDTLGIETVRKGIQWIQSRLGPDKKLNMKAENYNIQGFRRYCMKALRDNDVLIDTEGIEVPE